MYIQAFLILGINFSLTKKACSQADGRNERAGGQCWGAPLVAASGRQKLVMRYISEKLGQASHGPAVLRCWSPGPWARPSAADSASLAAGNWDCQHFRHSSVNSRLMLLHHNCLWKIKSNFLKLSISLFINLARCLVDFLPQFSLLSYFQFTIEKRCFIQI